MKVLWGWVQAGRQTSVTDPSGLTPHFKVQSLSPFLLLSSLFMPAYLILHHFFSFLHPLSLSLSPSWHVTFISEAHLCQIGCTFFLYDVATKNKQKLMYSKLLFGFLAVHLLTIREEIAWSHVSLQRVAFSNVHFNNALSCYCEPNGSNSIMLLVLLRYMCFLGFHLEI